MKRLQELFSKLNPKQKKLVVMGISLTIFLIFGLLAYNQKKSNQEPTQAVTTEKKEVKTSFNSKDDELAMRIGLKQQIDEVKEINREKANEIEELKSMIAGLTEKNIKEQEDGAGSYGDLNLRGTPPPPDDSFSYRPNLPAPPPTPPIVIVGGIGRVQGNVSRTTTETQKAAGKKWINFIPAGTILKATLLNGMFAPTMSKGQSKPYPALMRVWDLGFLPNDVRKDLSGCFVLGQAYGELSDSRVHIRLETISCISNDQKKVLEKDIKGFVSGDDGKVGIFGEIRANFGKVALTALLAEFLSAAGSSIKAATQVVTQTPLGGIQTMTRPSEQDMLVSAAGAGLGQAASMIADFYLSLMKEMSPVVEVSGRREVELVISKGVELMLEDFDWEGIKDEENFNFNFNFDK